MFPMQFAPFKVTICSLVFVSFGFTMSPLGVSHLDSPCALRGSHPLGSQCAIWSVIFPNLNLCIFPMKNVHTEIFDEVKYFKRHNKILKILKLGNKIQRTCNKKKYT